MPIFRLLKDNDHAFGPDEIAVIAAAFEDALRELRLVDRDDAATLMVAKRIFELAKRGERDPTRLREGAMIPQGLKVRSTAASDSCQFAIGSGEHKTHPGSCS